MKTKGAAAELLKHHIGWVEPKTDCMVKNIVLHGGIKFVKGSKELQADGIKISTIASYTPEENERAESMNRTIKNDAVTFWCPCQSLSRVFA